MNERLNIKRHALFVGVNTYDDKSIRKLRYSIPDASVLEDRFKGLGYKTRLLTDPTGAELKSAVEDSVEGLGRGDVFLFFFAGHGFTAQDGAHLLFCRDDRQRLLRVNAAGVRVDALEALTEGGGFHRAFLLDSCRTDCFAGMEGRGGGTTRDLDFVAVPECTEESGSYFLLRSCDKFRPSLELDGIGHGLFTQALLAAMDARDGRLASCDTSFATAVGAKMADIQRSYNVNVPQRPSMGECSGPVFSLFENGFLAFAEQVTPQQRPIFSRTAPALVVCPVCGRKNSPENTFRCRECGRDNLCLRHQDAKTFLCANCADAQRKAQNVEAKTSSLPSGTVRHRRSRPQSVSAEEANEKGENFYYGRNGFAQSYADAVSWYRFAAEQGHADAQFNLGVMYDDGRGVEQDYEEAVKWYRKAAEQGHAGAQWRLGMMYAQGNGVPKDDCEAAKWYRKSAEQGDADAQILLGTVYAEGCGVPKDDREAVKWHRKSAEQGNVYAQYNLGVMYAEGHGVPKDDCEAVKWYRKAAEQGLDHAQYNLGVMYEEGHGVPKDEREAVKWYRMAAEQDHKAAKAQLKTPKWLKWLMRLI